MDWLRSTTTVFPWVQAVTTAAIVYALAAGYDPRWWLLSLAIYFATGCLGVTVTFHRYLTHRSFRMSRFKEILFSLFGALGGTGSSIGWVATHRQHHRFADRPGDPHSPRNGRGILASAYDVEFDRWSVRRLVTDPFHRLLHEYYHGILIAWAALLLAIGPTALLFGFLVPVGIQLWASNLSNYFSHLRIGYRNFDTDDDSANVWWLALITWGEGWHNNHHRYPARWNFTVMPWEFDVSAWVIRAVRQP